MPVAIAVGSYVISVEGLDHLYENDQVIFQYCNASGDCTPESNLNGSTDHIAGICNTGKNVYGMMPHPERASEPELGNSDGKFLFESLIESTVGTPLAAPAVK
jgi:phosphoribosylformylglycinamidine synthase